MPGIVQYQNVGLFGSDEKGFSRALAKYIKDNNGNQPSDGDLNKLFSFYSPNSPKTPTGDGGGANTPSKFNKAVSGGIGIVDNLISTQLTQGAVTSSGEGYAIEEVLDILRDKNKTAKEKGKVLLDKLGSSITDQLKKESELRNQINASTNLSGELSQKLRDDIEQASISTAKFGIGMKDLGEIFTELVNQSGKFNLINQETFEKAAPTIRAFLDSSSALGRTIAEFEKVGVGTNKTIDLINKAGTKSVSLGLSGKKVVADITTQIGKLNEYGFSKGVEGLTRMVQKSLEFKMNLESVYKIAEDVMDPEKALSLSANLQVLGGAIGDFGDPIKLMYNATNNIEGIQDALIGAAGSLATYNLEQGRFEITGLNLRKARQMANDLGISLSELTKGAIAAAERTSAATAIMRSGLQMSEDDKEFLTNLSHMEGGQMVISIPKSLADQLGKPTEMALDQLDETTAKSIIEFQKRFSEMTAEDIAKEQLTEIENIARDVQVLSTYAKIRSVKLLKEAGQAVGDVTGLKDLYSYLKKEISEGASSVSGKGGKENTDKGTQAMVSVDNTLKGNTNPGGFRTHTMDLYPQAISQFTNLTKEGTEEGSKETTEKIKISVQETKDLNSNIKTTSEKQNNLYSTQIENQKQTKDSINNVASNVIESGKNVTENISETTENNNKLFTTLKTETNKVGTTENLDKINTNFSSAINDILVKKETKESNLIEGKTSNFENLVSLVTNTSKNISDNLNKNTSEIFTKSVENKNEFSDVNKQFTQLFTRKDEIVTSKESTKEDFQNYFQNFRTSLEENKTNVSELITNEKNKKTEQVEYNESINKTLKNQAVTVEENILPKNTIQTENVITPKQIVGRPTETLNTPNVINATTEPLISGRNEIIEKTIEKEPVTTTETNKGESKPSTVTIVHKHEFGAVQSLLDPLQREMFRNPELYQTDINKRDYRSQEIVLST